MRSIGILAFLPLLLCLPLVAVDAPGLRNGDFAAGLAGWTAEGPVSTMTGGMPDGGACAVLGPHARLTQRYAFPGSRHLWVQATVLPQGASVARFDLRHLAADGHELMTLSSDRDTRQKKDGVWGYWLRVHPRAASVELVLANDGDASVRVGQVVLKDSDDGDETVPAPTCDLDGYAISPWEGPITRDETVLMLSHGGAPARGRLLFEHPRILGVRDARLEISYEEGRDFIVQDQDLVCLPGSRMPQMRDSDFEAGDLKWYNISGKHVCVTYEHVDHGPLPTLFREDSFPATMRALRSRTPMTVVSYGDSITFGLNASRTLRVPPYLPTWAQLVVGRLRKDFGHDAITLYDSSLSGGDSAGGARLAARMVGTLAPDLVLVAFGMNDFWSTEPAQYRAHIETIIAEVRATRPAAEFILIAPMEFDPEYTKDARHGQRLKDYGKALSEIRVPGVQVVNMAIISKGLFQDKKPKDLLTDPLHPNDYMVRWHATAIYRLFDQGSPRPAASP